MKFRTHDNFDEVMICCRDQSEAAFDDGIRATATQSTRPQASYRKLTVPSRNNNENRTVSYSIIEAVEQEADKTTAIVHFYPLSSCSAAISRMQLSDHRYRCSLLSVDRPSCAESSPLADVDEDGNHLDSEALFVHRIQGHAQDVLAVLLQERIHTVYVLGVCIGHPYAVEVCRQLISLDSSSSPSSSFKPRLAGLTLIAPFVSTACPQSWRVAKFGARIPRLVLWGATEFASVASSWLVPSLVGPNAIKSLLTTEEERAPWTEADYAEAHKILLEMTPLTKNSKGIEARLGVSEIWQTEVCDKFAVESGCGLVVDGNGEEDEDAKNLTQQCKFPIRIHASRQDKLASLSSVEWISRRCYGNSNIIIEEDIHSHEAMTFFSGPPRNPILLHKVAGEWGLLSTGKNE